VQFERDEEDPFGLDQFLDTAKRASGSNKRTNDDRKEKDGKRSRKDY
jgi:SNW domain-containing protein 1